MDKSELILETLAKQMTMLSNLDQKFDDLKTDVSDLKTDVKSLHARQDTLDARMTELTNTVVLMENEHAKRIGRLEDGHSLIIDGIHAMRRDMASITTRLDKHDSRIFACRITKHIAA